VILSYAYWQKKFGGATSVIGSTDHHGWQIAHQIIGVLPRASIFSTTRRGAGCGPSRWDRSKVKLGNFSQRAMARLKPGVTMQQAGTDMARLAAPSPCAAFRLRMGSAWALFEKAHFAPNLRPLKQDVVGDMGKVLWVLMGSIAMVLLVACANVANLLLVRVEGRRQELAIRSALGAPWGRTAAELLFESLMLGVAGSAHRAGPGLRGFAGAGSACAHRVAAHSRDRHRPAGAAVHLWPGARHQPADRHHSDHEICRSEGGHRDARRRPRAEPEPRAAPRAQGLVIVQVALALVLLICSGLMIRTFQALMRVNPGFTAPDSLQTFRFYIPDTQIPESSRSGWCTCSRRF
jgi:hypothetical protein